MDQNGVEVSVPVPMYLEHDIEVDENGACSLISLLFVGDDEDPVEIRSGLEAVVEDVIEMHQDIGVEMYKSLYSIAHEFSRMSEMMRNAAGLMEDSVAAVEDLFEDRFRDVD